MLRAARERAGSYNGVRRVGEFVVEFISRLPAQDAVGNFIGTLHLHATDGPRVLSRF